MWPSFACASSCFEDLARACTCDVAQLDARSLNHAGILEVKAECSVRVCRFEASAAQPALQSRVLRKYVLVTNLRSVVQTK